MEARLGFLPEHRQLFGAAESLGEAMRDAVRAKWPTNTTKAVAKGFGLDATTAENIVKGHTSERSLVKAIKAAGWGLWMALGGLLIGHSYEHHLQRIIEENTRATQRMEQHRATVRGLEARASELVSVGHRMAAE